MKQDHRVVFAPHWVVETLQRKRLPLTAILELNKLRGVLSAKDIVAIALLNDQCFDLAGDPHRPSASQEVTRSYETFSYRTTWYETASQADRNWLESTFNYLYSEPTSRQELDARLFSPDVDSNLFAEPDEKAFIIYDLDQFHTLISIQAGHFIKGKVSGRRSLQLDLVKAVLKVFYVHMPYNQMANTVWFGSYLSKLNPYRLS